MSEAINEDISVGPLTINQLVFLAYTRAKKKGFYDIPEGANIPLKIALIHSEVSEALEELRASGDLHLIHINAKGKPEGFLVELADVVIRVADLVGYVVSLLPGDEAVNFEEIIEMKMNYNKTREPLHGKKF